MKALLSGEDFNLPRWGAVIGITVLLVFGVTLWGGFFFDDEIVIVKNRYLESPSAWPNLFTRPLGAGSNWDIPLFRPLPMVTFALNHAAGGLRPWGYHAGNLLLHTLNAFMLFWLARKLDFPPPVCALASLLFALHPIQAEAVAAVVGRFDLLACAGMLAAVLLFHAGRDRLALLAFIGALLSKEHAIATPVLLSCLPGLERSWRRLAIYPAIIVLYLIARFTVLEGAWSLQGIPFLDNPLAHLPYLWRTVSALWVGLLYLKHLVLPWGLSPDYSYRQIPPIEGWDDLRIAFVAVFLIGVGFLFLKALKDRTMFWLVVAALAPFLVVSNLPFPIGTVMADRLLYLSMPALCLGAAVAMERWRFAPPSRFVVPAVLLALAVLSARQSSFWHDGLRLWKHGTLASPLSAKAHANYGNELIARGRYQEAIGPLEEAVGIYSDFWSPHGALARCYQQADRLNEAAAQARTALRLQPGQAEMAYIIGQSYLKANRPDRVRRWWRLTLNFDPRYPNALLNLGNLAWMDDRPGEALDYWLLASRLENTLPETWYNLGMAYEKMGSTRDAVSAYQRFLACSGIPPAAAGAARQRLGAIQGLSSH